MEAVVSDEFNKWPLPVFSCPGEQDVPAFDYIEIPLAEEADASIKFSYQSNAEMLAILRATEERCPEIARTYSIGRSMEGSDLLVIEFSNNPGLHELREFLSNRFLLLSLPQAAEETLLTVNVICS